MSYQSLEELLQAVGNPVEMAETHKLDRTFIPRFQASSRTGGTSSTPGRRPASSSTSPTT